MDLEIQNILLVEDNPGDARLLQELLNEGGEFEFSLTHVDKITLALEHLVNDNYDLLLLDLSLPDSNGLETVRLISHADPSLPIIVMTGLEDDELASEAVQIGAQDYLIKGQVTSAILKRAMSHAITRKKMEEKMSFLATHDSLTQLPNRTLFNDRLQHSIHKINRWQQGNPDHSKIAVMILDLDFFKTINDNFGHFEGDHVLQLVAERLVESIRLVDTVARMGGDEFMMIFEDVGGVEDIKKVAAKTLSVFSLPFRVADQELHITASAGISICPDNGDTYRSLLQAADIALYQAKEKRNCFKIYQ